jgi:hypothetical protein
MYQGINQAPNLKTENIIKFSPFRDNGYLKERLKMCMNSDVMTEEGRKKSSAVANLMKEPGLKPRIRGENPEHKFLRYGVKLPNIHICSIILC